MAGNVWEWCLNEYDDPNQITIDGSDDARVLRGGSWLSDPPTAAVAIPATSAASVFELCVVPHLPQILDPCFLITDFVCPGSCVSAHVFADPSYRQNRHGLPSL